nr:ligase-associated DNA damage response DEXH box helicase [Pseudomonas sp.]
MTRKPSSPQFDRVHAWFASRGWTAAAFQVALWQAVAEGRSGLLHAGTGSGKTYAVWLGALAALARPDAPVPVKTGRRAALAEPLQLLWLTPMRALAADTERALREPMPVLAPAWSVGSRTGDTAAAQRAAQARRLPSALITTPESLSLLLSRADARTSLGKVRFVVVDEWHELLGNKRGVQVQLALARLRRWCPGLQVWGLSATLGNLDEAMSALLGDAASQGVRIQGEASRPVLIDTLLPDAIERFPWAGHLGMKMLPQVVAEIEASQTALVFTNTRSQSELWYQAILNARPDWAGSIALHHGSLDRSVRDWVENGLKEGVLRAVVCTSSLDLGVDFLPVERVLQIGSAKGVARLLQRAGRSGHAPGRTSRITLVPTHSLEVVEAAAVRDAAQAGHVEARRAPDKPLDVLVQHLVTVGLGGGFMPASLLEEVRTTHSYRGLAQHEWEWCLGFVAQGGDSLRAYPDYRRVEPDENGCWKVPDARLARRHRLNIGTIVSDASMTVRYWSKGNGGALGSVEESFIARLSPGDCFLFAGRLLELVRVQEMTAYVKCATGKRAAVPRWNGARMAFSSELADALVARLHGAAGGCFDTPEMLSARPLLELQASWSCLPAPDSLLIETLRSREGSHAFLYPFAGRHVHLGLAALLAWRIGSRQAATFSIAVNDYGLELLSSTEIDWASALALERFAEARLQEDVLASLNASELARRRFREIARVSGLIFQGNPAERKSSRQLQASSGLFYDVFRQYDPGNLLLGQAESEVLSQELDIGRLKDTLRRIRAGELRQVALRRPSPFAFPLMVERFREQLSTETLADRITRMVAGLEQAAGGGRSEDTGATAPDMAFALDSRPSKSSARRRQRKPSRPLPLL